MRLLLHRSLLFGALLAGGLAVRPAEAQTRTDTTVTLDASATVQVFSRSGDITVRAGSGRQLRVRSTDGPVDVSGSSRALRIDTERARGRNAGDLVLEIPRGTTLSIRTTSGNIQITGTGADVEVRSTSGDLRITDAARVYVEALSGDVELRDITDGVRVSTTSGDITGTNVTGDIEIAATSSTVSLRETSSKRIQVKVVSGDIRFTGGLADAGRYEFATHSGDVRLTLPRSARATLEVQTFSGSMSTSDLPLTLVPNTGDAGRAEEFQATRDSIRRQVRDSLRREEERRPRNNRDSGTFERNFERSVERLVESVLRSVGSSLESVALNLDGLSRRGTPRRLQLGEAGGPLITISSFSGNIVIGTGANDRR